MDIKVSHVLEEQSHHEYTNSASGDSFRLKVELTLNVLDPLCGHARVPGAKATDTLGHVNHN